MFAVGVNLADIIEINPIYFDFDKANIRPDAAIELDKIVKVMADYPGMVIELDHILTVGVLTNIIYIYQIEEQNHQLPTYKRGLMMVREYMEKVLARQHQIYLVQMVVVHYLRTSISLTEGLSLLLLSLMGQIPGTNNFTYFQFIY